MAVWKNHVYFQGDNGALYRIGRDGKDAKQLFASSGRLVVPGDNNVYFKADGLYSVPSGGGQAKKLDPNCTRLVAPGDGWVYLQAGSKGLYRVPCNGLAPAKQLDPNCGALIASGGYIYFRGGPNTNMLYRFGAAPPYLPAGFRARVQDEYVVETVLDGPIGEKRTAIANLLDEALNDSSDTWFVNFTSGTSTGAYPDAVAGRINDSVKSGVVSRLLLKKNRLGTIVMDFPDNNGNTSVINTIFAYNKDAAPEATDWMRNIPDSTKLSQLTIPGTHDTCSSNATKMSKCQNLTLPEQLNAGIRFVDIRCRHYQDKLFLHHGSEYLGMDFNYALKACRDLLKAHPTECIIMSVKEEHVPAENEKSFDEVFTDYVSPFLNLLHYDSNIPKLGDVRGKGSSVSAILRSSRKQYDSVGDRYDGLGFRHDLFLAVWLVAQLSGI